MEITSSIDNYTPEIGNPEGVGDKTNPTDTPTIDKDYSDNRIKQISDPLFGQGGIELDDEDMLIKQQKKVKTNNKGTTDLNIHLNKDQENAFSNIQEETANTGNEITKEDLFY